MKFIHRFNKKLLVEMTVSDSPPPAGQSHIRAVAWTRRPEAKHLPEYVKWIHSVNEYLSGLWGISIMHCFQTSSQSWECWMYEPGKPAENLPPNGGS